MPGTKWTLIFLFQKKLFGERGKLYRFHESTKEWKERGVGEIKILHHPVRNSYRLLLRREQVCVYLLLSIVHTNVDKLI